MKLDQPSSGKLNFGDDLNSWLWPQLIPECLRENDGIHFLGIGTLLKAKRFKKQLRSECKIVIFSSGSWGTNLPQLDRRYHIYGVLGPRTAHALGLSDDMVIGDGAYLLRKVIHPLMLKVRWLASFHIMEASGMLTGKKSASPQASDSSLPVNQSIAFWRRYLNAKPLLLRRCMAPLLRT